MSRFHKGTEEDKSRHPVPQASWLGTTELEILATHLSIPIVVLDTAKCTWELFPANGRRLRYERTHCATLASVVRLHSACAEKPIFIAYQGSNHNSGVVYAREEDGTLL